MSRRGLLDRRLAAAIAAGAAAVGLLLYAVGALERLESATLDTRTALRGDRAPDPRVILVKVDGDTFAALGRGWPLPRSLHARAVDRLHAAGARVIAYDVQFSEPTTTTEDNALIEAVRRAGNVVLAATEVDEAGTANVLGSGAAQRAARVRVGHAGFPVEPGGVIRKVPAAVDGLPSLAHVVAASFAGGGDAARSGGSDWIDFAGPPGTYPALDLADVVSGSFDADRVRGKAVVIGAFAPSLQDVHPTAASPDELMPGAEVQANAIATVLRGAPLESAPWPLALLAIAVLGGTVPLAATRLRLLLLPLAGGLALAYAVVLQLAFDAGVVLPVVAPGAALVVASVAVLTATVTVTTVEHRRTRGQLERFVPPGLVGEMLDHVGEDGMLAGKEVVATVLAADMRGFTTFAERTPPATVVDVLNLYFASMGEAVEAHGGVLCSFAGDGLIAVFGAPLELPDHASRALDAAREMAGWRLAAFNERLRAEGLSTRFAMGIGIASGPLVTGTIGSPRRLEFTAIGDTVNVAARVEQLTKEWARPVLVAGSSAALARGRDDLVRLSETEVRGRGQSLELWALTV